uniref:BHLH domain-containing protein n=1 Tax=Timema monikensis TaxID=170555 RepID=A0A7R9EFI1_9NEOP|nr:unnamed protein product [Timema monikensis]
MCKLVKRGECRKKKRRLLVQNGGTFLPLLLDPLISGVLGFLFNNQHPQPSENTNTTTSPAVSVLPIPAVLNTVPAQARKKDELLHKLSVNSAFTTLRTLIPTEPVDRKLSKIETLRLASSYISHLQAQLVAVYLFISIRSVTFRYEGAARTLRYGCLG